MKSWDRELSNDICVDRVYSSSVPSIRQVWEFEIIVPDAENREFEGTDDFCTPSTHTFSES
eukprot:COSAG02_NODE_1239_length_13713_cov_37.434259_15_plen_61_part_00